MKKCLLAGGMFALALLVLVAGGGEGFYKPVTIELKDGSIINCPGGLWRNDGSITCYRGAYGNDPAVTFKGSDVRRINRDILTY